MSLSDETIGAAEFIWFERPESTTVILREAVWTSLVLEPLTTTLAVKFPESSKS